MDNKEDLVLPESWRNFFSWAFSLFIFLLGVLTMAMSVSDMLAHGMLYGFLLGLLFIIFGLFFFPPVRKEAYRLTKIKTNFSFRLVISVALFLGVGFAISPLVERDKNIKEALRVEALTKRFALNQDGILEEMARMKASGDYERLLQKAEKYLVINDAQVKEIYNEASQEVAEQNAKKEALTSRKNRINKQFSEWNGAHLYVQHYITQSMHDPKSYEHINTSALDKGDHLLINTTFRGRNAFGALVVNSAKATVDLDGNILSFSYKN